MEGESGFLGTVRGDSGNPKVRRPDLKALLEESSSHWGYEDPIYRFYHHSFKVFALQKQTEKIVSALQLLLPTPLNARFLQIVHARFFLEMAARYADLPIPPNPLPSGWAALLYLYELR